MNVTLSVRIAQYLSLVIALIMEEEIPESLHLLQMISGRTLRVHLPDRRYGRFVLSASLRILMGYLFYLNAFLVVAQATSVIDIFFDVLALHFVQQIDDIVFKLSRMDVLGRTMKRASLRGCFGAEFEKLSYARRRKVTIFVKTAYFLNLVLMIGGMAVVTTKQARGDYQCPSVTVKFDDLMWENALVVHPNIKRSDLIYSYFNGVYVRNGMHHGRPVYTEQNKFDNSQYRKKIGATIKYCNEEGAWVFMHDHIRKDFITKNSTCPWLMRSPETNSFNLLEVSGGWSMWTGVINTGVAFQTTCNGCNSEADCNYHGACKENTCVCKGTSGGIAAGKVIESGGNDLPLYFGMNCEFPRPCGRIVSYRGTGEWALSMIDDRRVWNNYGRGVYTFTPGITALAQIIAPNNESIVPPEVQAELNSLGKNGGKDHDLVLFYSGSRWFGGFFNLPKDKGKWLELAREGHAFWDEVYKENTLFVSAPTTLSDPIAVDFFRIGRRGAQYGPLGELIPIAEYPGSGNFYCAANHTDDIQVSSEGNSSLIVGNQGS